MTNARETAIDALKRWYNGEPDGPFDDTLYFLDDRTEGAVDFVLAALRDAGFLVEEQQ